MGNLLFCAYVLVALLVVKLGAAAAAAAIAGAWLAWRGRE